MFDSRAYRCWPFNILTMFVFAPEPEANGFCVRMLGTLSLVHIFMVCSRSLEEFRELGRSFGENERSVIDGRLRDHVHEHPRHGGAHPRRTAPTHVFS